MLRTGRVRNDYACKIVCQRSVWTSPDHPVLRTAVLVIKHALPDPTGGEVGRGPGLALVRLVLAATASPWHHLLIRRHLRTGKQALHYCFAPARQPVTITRLIRAARLHWPVEEQFRADKDFLGLDSLRSASSPRSLGKPCWS
jgi:hypothetical protein